MADPLEDAKRKAEAEASDDGLVRIAEKIGASAGANAVFGSPVERDGVTVIPVARVRWGFGGGRGRRKGMDNDGSGAGGGVQAAPLGFIEVHDGAAEYRRIHDPMRLALASLLFPVAAAASVTLMFVAAAVMARSLRRSLRLPRPHLPGVHVPHLPGVHLPGMHMDDGHVHGMHLVRPHLAVRWHRD
jgi:uncharacterized spore protein YtfJ